MKMTIGISLELKLQGRMEIVREINKDENIFPLLSKI